MFKKFGFGGAKKEEVKPVAQAPKAIDKDLKYEKTIHDIKTKIQVIDDQMERVDQKVSDLDRTIRELLVQKKGPQAKGKIGELKGYQKQLETHQTKRNMLTQMQIQIENLEQDRDLVDIVTNATELSKDAQAGNDKLQDAMLDYKELQQSQLETQELWKQMGEIGVDQEEIDEEFAKYSQEVDASQQQELNNKFNNIPASKISQPVQVQQQSVYKSKQDEHFQNSIQQLLD